MTTLTCAQVLEVLSDYLDGELDTTRRAAVEAHLAGCDACTRFGGEVGAVVQALRERLRSDEDVPQSVAKSLAASLRLG